MKDKKLKKLEDLEELEDFVETQNNDNMTFEQRYPNIKKINESNLKKMFVLAGIVRTKVVPDLRTIRNITGMNYYTCKKWMDYLKKIPLYAPLGTDKQRAIVEKLIETSKQLVRLYETVTPPDEAYNDPLPTDIISKTKPQDVPVDDNLINVENLAFDYSKSLTDADFKKFKEFKKEEDDNYEEIDFANLYKK